MARSSFAPLPPRLPPLSLALPSPGLPLPLPGPVLTPALPLTPALSKTARMHFLYGVPCTPYGVEPDYVLVHCNFFFVHPEYSYRCMYVCMYIYVSIYIYIYQRDVCMASNGAVQAFFKFKKVQKGKGPTGLGRCRPSLAIPWFLSLLCGVKPG